MGNSWRWEIGDGIDGGNDLAKTYYNEARGIKDNIGV